jgi:long-chain acyl-CoA synthetase
MNIAAWLERTARARPAATALLAGAEPVADYTAFARRAAGLAGRLAARGVAPGDRVAIWAANAPEYLVALWGIWWAGAAAVPVNARLHAREAAWILGHSGARCAFVDRARGEALAETCPVPRLALDDLPEGDAAPLIPRAPADLAWLFYTSGTTGRPKGVRITHAMLAATSLAYPVDVDPVSPDDCALYAAPMSHGAGIYAPVHVLHGARHAVPAASGFDPAEVLRLAAALGNASMFLAPTMLRRLLDAARASGDRAEGIRTIVYGGGPMYLADLEAALDWFGPKLVQIYGQGECPMAITALPRDVLADRGHPRWRERAAGVGRAQSVVEVAVDAEEGGAGEVLVRGLPVMPGYWEAPEASAAALRDGWLRTGDIGRLDPEGYLTLVDRSKDVVITGGSNVYPREVEEALLEHEAVREAAVIGRPDPDWGEALVAVVALEREVGWEVLDAHLLERIARHKRPKHWHAVEALPKNAYGKVLKTELRERFGGG